MQPDPNRIGKVVMTVYCFFPLLALVVNTFNIQRAREREREKERERQREREREKERETERERASFVGGKD